MAFNGSGAPLTSLNASNLASGTVPTARLGSGTANSSTFLRGDQTYAAVAAAPNPLHGSQVFTSNGTFTAPSGVTNVKVTVIGAGGNGGNGSGEWYAGAGGGAGGYVVAYVAIPSGGTASVTIGANSGTRTSSFAVSGGSTITASGGTNGANASYGQPQPAAGTSGAGTIFGQPFYTAGSSRATDGGLGAGVITYSGSGTDNRGQQWNHGYGAGGNTRTSTPGSLNRQNAVGFGGGGGGGSTDPSYLGGGTGANGVVVVEW